MSHFWTRTRATARVPARFWRSFSGRFKGISAHQRASQSHEMASWCCCCGSRTPRTHGLQDGQPWTARGRVGARTDRDRRIKRRAHGLGLKFFSAQARGRGPKANPQIIIYLAQRLGALIPNQVCSSIEQTRPDQQRSKSKFPPQPSPPPRTAPALPRGGMSRKSAQERPCRSREVPARLALDLLRRAGFVTVSVGSGVQHWPTGG